MIRSCKVCGASYKTCYSCEAERSWKVHTDTQEHYYIFTVLMQYLNDHDARRAYSALRKRGIDLREVEGYIPSVQKLMTEINTLARENYKAKKPVVEVKVPDTEEKVDSEAEEQQE